MKHSFPLIIFAGLSLFLLSSCVDPNYYNTGTTYSGSATFTTLPHGYRTIYVSGTPYYYYGSSWYRRSGGHYISCSRPYGYHGTVGRPHHYHGISRLPYGCRTTYVGGHRYYTHGSTWYRKSGSRYVRCSKPSSYHSDRHKTHHRTDKHRDHDTSLDHNRSRHEGSKKHSKKSQRTSQRTSQICKSGDPTNLVNTDKPKQLSGTRSLQKRLSQRTFTRESAHKSARSDKLSRPRSDSKLAQQISTKPRPTKKESRPSYKNRISKALKKRKD